MNIHHNTFGGGFMNYSVLSDLSWGSALSLVLNALAAIVALWIGWNLIKIVKKQLRGIFEKTKVDESLRTFLLSLLDLGLKVLLIVSVVGIVGIPTAPFVAVLGAAGLAVGLALQGSLSNFAGGVIILIMKPFKVSDYIESQGYSGTVEEIQIFYTRLVTVDNKTINIPNGTLANSNLTNYSSKDKRRADFKFGVGYESDIEKVKKIIYDILYNHPLTLKDPDPFVRLAEHGESSLNFVARVWCNSGDYWNIHFDVIEQVKIAFDKEGVNIPYPHMDVNVISNKN